MKAILQHILMKTGQLTKVNGKLLGVRQLYFLAEIKYKKLSLIDNIMGILILLLL
jgi:hypothetical protein